jgi:hypothetical protein
MNLDVSLGEIVETNDGGLGCDSQQGIPEMRVNGKQHKWTTIGRNI